MINKHYQVIVDFGDCQKYVDVLGNLIDKENRLTLVEAEILKNNLEERYIKNGITNLKIYLVEIDKNNNKEKIIKSTFF